MHLTGSQKSPGASVDSSSSFPVNAPGGDSTGKEHILVGKSTRVMVAEIEVPPLLKCKEQRTKPSVLDKATALQIVTQDLDGSDPAACASALHELAELCERSKENRRTLYQAGGHLAIVQVLKMNLDDRELQSEGCCALANLTCLRDTQTMVGKIGAVELVLSVMRRHPDYSTLHQRALASLRNMIHGHHENASRLLSLRDGIATIANSMKSHARNARLQRNAIYTLTRLCESQACHKIVLKGGGLSALAIAFESHSDNPDLQILARKAIEQILHIPIRADEHDSCSSLSTNET